jgi:alpha-L-rhamnosidase
MKLHRFLCLLGLAAALAGNAPANRLTVAALRCEYRDNPVGIDEPAPRLSWQLTSTTRAQTQTAYRIRAASTPEKLARGEADLWDSGRVPSSENLHIRYAGRPLTARQSCHWQVQVWDQAGTASTWSEPAHWEIGLPTNADWSGASWIRLAGDPRSSPLTQRPVLTKGMTQPRLATAHPSPLLRREFTVRPGVTRARAYVSGLGYSETFLNGQRCGDAVLDPGQTSYDERALYVTHDITTALRPGLNAVGVWLGNGFLGQNHAFNAPGLGYAPPALLAKLVIDYADGSTEVIATDGTWKATTGPILYDNVYGGETYDARLEKTGWDRPGYDDSTWTAAQVVAAPAPRLLAQMIAPIRQMKTLPPVAVIAGNNGKWIFDLGQNIAGWAQIKLRAPVGTELTLRFSEILSADGLALDLITTGPHATGLPQTDIYVCKGGGEETWAPRFTYHGFRYVEVSGLPEKPSPDFLTGVLVHSDVAPRGSFQCSDELLNRIHRTSLWTLEDNLHSVLEDCPHREKCAWLGDTHAVGETAIFHYDMAQFFTKFADDIETSLGDGGVTYWGQKATPGIPCNVAVGRRLCQEARPDWGSAYVLLPWYLYQYYGDTAVFTRHYPHLKKWIEYVRGLREDGIVTRGYGDWCPPGGNPRMECPVPLTSTAYFHATVVIMADFARQLGKTDDATAYKQLAEETKAAFNRKFFNATTGGYGSQTADAVALRFALFPDGQQAAVATSLRRGVVEQHRGHAFVGIHGGRPLYTQLSAHGYTEVAIAALKQPTWPSYANLLTQGHTTWPEIFDEKPRGTDTAGRSLNHPMQSGFAAWFHESLGGIRPAAPGFKKILLEPHGYHQLAWVEAAHESPYGLIKSHWRSTAGEFTWHISIPPNTTAIVSVPRPRHRQRHRVRPRRHHQPWSRFPALRKPTRALRSRLRRISISQFTAVS